MKRKRLSSGGVITLCFAGAILVGTALLLLPVARLPGAHLSPIDAFFTATASVCVTGLGTVDIMDVFSPFGKAVLALLIQVGGLGVTTLGVGLILLARQRVNIRERVLVKEALAHDSIQGVSGLLRAVARVTLSIELVGAILGSMILSRDFPIGEAIPLGIFHAISSFNNAGIDVIGHAGLAAYRGHFPFMLVTCAMVILGGIGFTVISDVLKKRSLRKLTLTSKVVLTMTAGLLAAGTLLFRLTDHLPWLDAFFLSTMSRSAGFSIMPMGSLSSAGLFIMTALMMVGASPGSTGGGFKTTTLFAIGASIVAASRGRAPSAFKRKLPHDLLHKSFMIVLVSIAVTVASIFLLCLAEPDIPFSTLAYEAVAAFSTVGLSVGVTASLGMFSKIVLIVTMLIGRLGPLTIAGLWAAQAPSPDISYIEEPIAIG